MTIGLLPFITGRPLAFASRRPRRRGLPNGTDEFATVICRQFDVRYGESADSGGVMAVALHPYITGRLHRIDALDAASAYVCRHNDVWLSTRSNIVEAYLASGATI